MFDDHYDHVYESVSRNENYKLNMSDFSLYTDHEIEAQRQDLGNKIIINKREASCQIIDVAVAEDGRVRAKEDEKLKKYQDLAKEVRRVWKLRKKH